MNKITIAYAPDNNVLPLTLVSMASVLQNAKKTRSTLQMSWVDDIVFMVFS